MIEKASLQNMTLNSGPVQRKGGGAKQFEIRCVVMNEMAPAAPPQVVKPLASPNNAQAVSPSTYL